MTPTKTGRTTQLSVRVEHDLVARLDELAEKLSRPGLPVGRADVIRMALLEGLPRLEAPAESKPKRGR